MSNPKNSKCIGEKVALSLKTCMQANKLDGSPSNSFLTLLICLQCSDNDFGGGDILWDVLYEPGGKVDLISVVFSSVVGYTKRDKNSVGCHECVGFLYDQF